MPHDGQQSSMMNEKHVQKKPGVDHPIASVDDLGAYEVAESESEVRMPTRQPSLGREPVRKQV